MQMLKTQRRLLPKTIAFASLSLLGLMTMNCTGDMHKTAASAAPPLADLPPEPTAGSGTLAFVDSLGAQTAGTLWQPQPRVAWLDANQQLVSPPTGSQVQLSVAHRADGQKTDFVAAWGPDMRAQFHDVQITRAGSHVLRAVWVNASGASPSPAPASATMAVEVLPATAACVALTGAPSAAVVGHALTPPVRLAVVDAFANQVDSGLASAAQLAVSVLGSDPAALLGPATGSAAAGSLVLPDLRIDTAGATTLVASGVVPAAPPAAQSLPACPGPPVVIDVAAGPPASLSVAATGSDATASSAAVALADGQASLLATDTTVSASGWSGGQGASAAATPGILALGLAGGCDGRATNCHVLDPSWTPHYDALTGYWPLEGSGAIADGTVIAGVVGPGLTAHNANGGGMTFAAGHLGGAVQLDGVDDYLQLPGGLVSSGALTVAGWVQRAAGGGNQQRFVDLGDGTTDYIQVTVNGGSGHDVGAAAEVGGNRYGLDPTLAGVPVGSWQHLAVTLDGNIFALYLNGRLIGAVVSPLTPADFSVSQAYFGKSQFNGDAHLAASLDELAIWSVALSAAEVQAVFAGQAAAFSGVATAAPVAATAGIARWQELSWRTPLPFGKPLPVATHESSSAYANVIPSLSDGLLHLWRLDESERGQVAGGGDFADSAPAPSSGHLQADVTGGPVLQQVRLGQPGRFATAVDLGSSGGYIATLQPQVPPASLTLGVWFSSWSRSGGRLLGFGDQTTGASSSPNTLADRHIYMTDDGRLAFGVVAAGSQEAIVTTAPGAYNDGLWHHAVATLGAAGMQLYVDGQQVAANSAVTQADSYSGSWRLGFDAIAGSSWPAAPTTSAFWGQLAEAAVWERELVAAEILQLYRRGGNRVQLQARFCALADCGDAPPWLKPHAAIGASFSELFNVDGGGPRAQAPSLDLAALLPPSGPPHAAYAQLRAMLASDDLHMLCQDGGGNSTACMPSIGGATLGAEVFAVDMPYMTFALPPWPKLSAVQAIVGSVPCPAGLVASLSADHTSWYTRQAGSWQLSDGSAATANPLTAWDPTALRDFARQVSWHGPSSVRVFLNSAGDMGCGLAGLELAGGL